MKAIALATLLIMAFASSVMAASRETQKVSGPGFEGVIFAPERVHENTSPGFYRGDEMWTPSRDVVLKAERALPAAIAAWTSAKPEKPGPNFPTCCPAKNGTNLRFTDTVPDPRPDSVIDGHSFLFDVAPRLSDFKRQYVGAIVNGKKLLYLSFVHNYIIETDSQDWRHHWIAILGGGDLTWSVLYDPATDSFSEWEG
jgi:hypothetical protein